MRERLLDYFGATYNERVLMAISQLQNGNGILLADDEDRENEVDIIFPAQYMTPVKMAFLIRECSGIVCLCLTNERCKELALPLMVQQNSSRYGTAFTVSIEAKKGVTTGVSASDRTTTILAAISDNAKPEDLAQPGHVFPLQSRPGGVLERAGHTEGTVDLMKLAGLKPAGILCELTNSDGSMTRLHEAVQFAIKNSMTLLSVKDIIEYYSKH